MSPIFPIRILFDDGEAVELESPEAISTLFDAFDSDDPQVWVRDATDRNVKLRVRQGIVEVLE